MQVSNARFVVLSDSEVPLYNAGALYMQLMLSHRSRTGETLSYVDTLKRDGVRVPFNRVLCLKHACSAPLQVLFKYHQIGLYQFAELGPACLEAMG